MMDYRENAGYLITDSCHVGDSEFVLGVHLTEPHQFVTWKCTNQTDYYWGHYFSDLFSAQKDHCLSNAFRFPVGRNPGVQNALPRRLFRQHGGAWRYYGQPEIGGKGISKRSAKLWIYRGGLSLF